MEKRILLEKRGRSDDQITELILDNCRSTYVDGLTDSFTALETLSLINVGLVSLKNFPKLSNLRKLELSDNRISNGLSHLTGSPKLTHLNLSGNRIKDFEELYPLKDLESLEVLDLFNNQVTLIENYRDKIFQLIPSLTYLDGFDKDFAEAPSDDEDIAGRSNQRHPSKFSINGIEIDLDELEEFESHIQQKRLKKAAQVSQSANVEQGASLGQLELNGNEDIGSPHKNTMADGKDDIDQLYEEIQRNQTVKQTQRDQQCEGKILRDTGSATEEEEDSCEESDDVSLAYLYNDDLEEDHEDWKSVESDYNNVDDEFDTEDEEGDEGGEENGDDVVDSDAEGGENDDGADGEDVQAGEEAENCVDAAVEHGVVSSPSGIETETARFEEVSDVKVNESEARGTKRKFDGTDSDG